MFSGSTPSRVRSLTLHSLAPLDVLSSYCHLLTVHINDTCCLKVLTVCCSSVSYAYLCSHACLLTHERAQPISRLTVGSLASLRRVCFNGSSGSSYVYRVIPPRASGIKKGGNM